LYHKTQIDDLNFAACFLALVFTVNNKFC